MGKQLATQAVAIESVPRLPPRLASLVDSTGSWSDQAGCLVGWRKPERLPVGMSAVLATWIPRLEAALAPMARYEPTKMALVRLQALLPRRNDDGAQLELWLEGMLNHLRVYPEAVVLEALHEAERKLKWRPSPAEVIAIIERDLAGPKDELQRMKWLQGLAETPALVAPKGKGWADMTQAERDAFDAKLKADLAGVGEIAAAAQPVVRPARRYLVVERGWERAQIDAWISGYETRGDGKIATDCRLADPALKYLWTEGFLVASGIACSDIALSDAQLDLIAELQSALASQRVDTDEYATLPA